jgi:hypothetical protein
LYATARDSTLETASPRRIRTTTSVEPPVAVWRETRDAMLLKSLEEIGESIRGICFLTNDFYT